MRRGENNNRTLNAVSTTNINDLQAAPLDALCLWNIGRWRIGFRTPCASGFWGGTQLKIPMIRGIYLLMLIIVDDSLSFVEPVICSSKSATSTRSGTVDGASVRLVFGNARAATLLLVLGLS